jgi:hypothetical protein
MEFDGDCQVRQRCFHTKLVKEHDTSVEKIEATCDHSRDHMEADLQQHDYTFVKALKGGNVQSRGLG